MLKIGGAAATLTVKETPHLHHVRVEIGQIGVEILPGEIPTSLQRQGKRAMVVTPDAHHDAE